MIPCYFVSRSFGSATSTRSGSKNFITSSWTRPVASFSAPGPRPAIAHCVLMSLCARSIPRHLTNCLMPNGATLHSEDYATDRRYWLEQFAQWPGPLLEIDRQNTERVKSGRPARIAFTLKRGDFTRLEAAARKVDASASRAIIALTYAAFARLYGRYNIVLGVELANRSDPKAKQAIGFLARPAPMLLTLDPTVSIADALRCIDETRARNYPHRHFPVQEIARELDITRKGHHGLFDVIVNYIPLAYEFAFEERPVELINLSYGFATPWMVTIADTGFARDLDITIDFDPGLIPHDMAAQMASCVETLLLRGLEDPACPLGSLPIMAEATRQQVLGFAAGETVGIAGRSNRRHALRRSGRTHAGRDRPDIRRAATQLCHIA